jgi:predicted acyl esterase
MERNVPLLLRDGTTLRADIYRPADAHKRVAAT